MSILQRIVVWVFICCCAQAAVAQTIPPPPPSSAPLMSLSAERFRPMTGSLPAEAYGRGGAVVLPINFAGTTHERASWDIEVSIDASQAQGIRFDFYCADFASVSQFVCYLRSGGGWYRAEFCPENIGQWETITIDKAQTSTEGTPAGWAKVDTIRISAWRGGTTDTTCAIANIGLVETKPQILVVRADSCVKPDNPEGKAYAHYAATVSQTLDAIGIPSIQISDRDLSATPLTGIRLVVLPYNPTLPDTASATLETFVKDGGKLLACYSTPPEALRLIGLQWQRYVGENVAAFKGFAKTDQGLDMQPAFAVQGSWRTMVAGPTDGVEARVIATWRNADDTDTDLPAITLTPTGAYIGHVWFAADNGNALMQAITGYLVPEFWEQAARAAFERIDKGVRLTATDAPQAAKAELVREQEERLAAEALLKKGEWKASLPHSAAAAAAARRAWYRAQPSRAGEFRAFWCHSAFGLSDKDWERAIRQLKEAGFNALLPNMLWAGTAYYPSAVLPQYGDIANSGDQIAKCLAACRKHGVEIHVWKVNWNTGGHAPKTFIELLVRENRHQVTYSGDKRAEWLCPSHPANQELEVASMLEVVRLYEVDGIHFDYIRYPDNDSCYCAGCKARFQERLGKPVTDWAQTRPGQPLFDAWQDFRRANISTVVQRVHDGAKAIRPAVKISAAVFGNWEQNRNTIAQDWKMWCENGWLDFICPMDYTSSVALFKNMVKQQKGQVGNVPLYPGIGFSCWDDKPGDTVRLIQQINALREVGVPGFTVFNYDRHAEPALPLLRLGAIATQ